MADEILSKLGFDVDDALSAIDRLDAKLQMLQGAFQQFGVALSAWNANTSGPVNVLTTIAESASRAASAMGRLNREYAKALATPPSSVAGPGGSLPATSPQGAPKLWLPPDYSQATASAKQYADAVQQTDEATKNAHQSTQRWVVSWQTLGRIVMTQMIVRAMSQIRDALRESVEASIDFQQHIAEVQTIAPQIGGSFVSLTSQAAEFAKQFNIPLGQATAGLYETISNQFEGMGERANIMAAAVKLSRTTLMDFKDAILLITGTLNTYGMTSDQAESVASKFFTTIKLGRVHGKELADTMGQVMPIAKELGVSLDEVNSAMVALTIGGLDAHKSVTALRSAMTAFLKPSEDMKRVVRDLGFSDPTQLVAAKGIEGALQAVAAAADDMAVKIAKDIPNVRGLIAEFRLTREGAKQVEDAMKAMQASTPEALDKVFKQFTSNDAEKLTSQINRLKIDLTEDFGSVVTRALGSVMQLVGGADHLSSVLQGLAFGIGPLVAALGILGVAFMTAQLAMGPVGWTLLGISAAIGVLAGGKTYLTAQSINETRRLAQAEHEGTMQYVRDKEEELRALRETETKKMAEEDRSWENRAAVIRKEYFKALDNLKDKNKEIIESDRQAMQSMVSSQERVVAAYRNAANAALRIVQESQNRRVGLEDQLSDLLFKKWTDEEVKFADSQKARLILERSWALEAQANQKLATAQTEDEVRRAQAIYQRADAYLKEGTELAKNTNEVYLQDQAAKSIRWNLEDRIKAEKKLEELQATRAQKLADESAKEQERLDTMKSLMKDILGDLQAFDKHGAKSPQELGKQQADLTAKLDQFREQWLGGKKVDVADLLAFDQLQRRVTTALEGGVSQAEVNKLYAAPDTFAKFRADIEKGIGPVQVMILTARAGGGEQLWRETEGMNAEEVLSHVGKRAKEAGQIIREYQAVADSLTTANMALERGRVEALAAADRWVSVGWVSDVRALGGVWERFTDHVANTPVVKQAREELIRAMAKFTEPNAEVSTEDLNKLKAAYDLYISVLDPSAKSKEALLTFIHAAESVADRAKKIEDINKGLDAMKGQVEEAGIVRPAAENALKAAEEAAKRAKESTGEVKTNTEEAGNALEQVSQIDMSGLVNQAQAIADAMWSVANASQMIQFPAAAAMTAAHGGTAWKLLAGGGPAGTDVIPAMLSPGEVVINAASARRFSAQLTAINAGVQPVYRSEGGNVTNIGDINVTVSGGGTSRQTARAIAGELRRELRRGTATL